ncbi:MAG TPA: pentapeptide repeat-containing protein, partial [Spirochaetia bacterium]|nr:pentapeptide repeat-containing protein [Spirochaetia bacterium]
MPRPCAQKGCGRPALAESTLCAVHHPDAASHVKEILRAARGAAGLRDLDLTGISLQDEDLGGMEISGCRLTAASFTRVRLSGAAIHLSFLDRAALRDCDFSGANIQNSVFAGSTIDGCTFTDA